MAEVPPPLPEEEPISLEEGQDEPIGIESPGTTSIKPTAVRTFGAGAAAARVAQSVQLKRTPNVNGQGAIRCRVFTSKIAAAPLQHMEAVINEWLDNNNIEIKHVAQVIGVMEGKTPEPNMIVTVWY